MCEIATGPIWERSSGTTIHGDWLRESVMLKVVSLYTGAGGLDLGLEAAGFRTTVAVEYDSTACLTLMKNRNTKRPWTVLERSIHDVSSDELMHHGGIAKGEAALLVGGPPCQPFSKSAYWARGDTKRLDDPRADTLSAYLRVLRDVQPHAFMLENVFGLTYKGKDEALSLLRDTVRRINGAHGLNYSFEWRVINTADYGVPQIRERFFLVGIRNGRRFQFPSPTHTNRAPLDSMNRGIKGRSQRAIFDESQFTDLIPWTNAWDAIGDLNDIEHPGLQVTGKWADLLPSIPEGLNYLHHTDRGDGLPLFGWRTRYWSFLLKLAKNKPSWTIQAQPGAGIGPFHWKSRRLSIDEMKRIQTFPDDYEIVGGFTEAQRQLGNAVPSLVAETLGRALLEQVFDRKPKSRSRHLCPSKADSLPAPERPRPVAKKYLALVGKHAPHPSTFGKSQNSQRT